MHPCLRGGSYACVCCTKWITRYVATKIFELLLFFLIIGLIIWYFIAVIEANMTSTQLRVVNAFTQ